MKKLIAFTAVFALLLAASPVFAAGDIVLTSENNADISTLSFSTASTGGNSAHGDSASNSTSGGNVSQVGFSNEAGNGGSTVLGGMGGVIRTGNASAKSSISTEVNTERTDVDTNPWATNEIRLHSDNRVRVVNFDHAGAETGRNRAHGDSASSATSGGDLDRADAENSAGNDGSHVEGGGGGEIMTGNATSESSIVTVSNRVVRSVRRQ
jgi:hypothetical protein